MLESPWPILVVGLVLELALAIALFQTRQGKLLLAMAGVALLVLAGLVIEHFTITDTKLVRHTLESAAAALLTNNAAQVDPCIVPDADGNIVRGQVKTVLGQVELLGLSIRSLEVKFNYQTSPPTAETNVMVMARGRYRGEMVEAEGSRPVAVTVKLRKESGRWLIYGELKYNVGE